MFEIFTASHRTIHGTSSKYAMLEILFSGGWNSFLRSEEVANRDNIPVITNKA